MRGRVVVAAASVAAIGLPACGGGGGGSSDERTPPRSPVAALRQAWSVDAGALWNAPPNSTEPWAWTTATSLIVPGKRELTSYAAADGAKQWTVALPRPVCAVADAPNEAGIGAVLLSGGTAVNPQACGAVAAIDTHTGRLLWTRSLRGRSSYGLTDVQVGPKAVAITNPCDRALTLSVRTGAPLATFPEREYEGCRHSYASDGRIVVDGHRHIADEEVVGYDAASGRRLWSVPTRDALPDRSALPTVERVISSSPVVVDASINDHRFLYRVDPKARTATPFGRQADDSFVPVFTRALDSRVVVQYGRSSILSAYDPASGDEAARTVLAAGESAVGVRDGAVVTVSTAAAGVGASGLAVRRTDPATGAQQVLGTMKLDGVAAAFGRGTGFDVAVVGDTMILLADRRLVAYRLPSRGPSASKVLRPPALAAGELAPDKAVDLCTGITAATKRALGFPDPALAAPADCQWFEPEEGGTMRTLLVSAVAREPRDPTSATDQARRELARLTRPDTVNDLPALTPLTGLGDEAAAGTSTDKRSALARVVVRVGNVVILVDALGDDRPPRTDELRVLQRGARLAAADLVAEVGRRR
jgi:outer membrane protein assembly factor BamB